MIKTETMLVTTTPSVEDRKIVKYIGLVTGETIIGANIFKDLFAGITDIVGGRSSSYERVLREGKDTAVNEMQQYAAALGANAIVGVDLDYETVGSGGSMLMVSANGTAVILELRNCLLRKLSKNKKVFPVRERLFFYIIFSIKTTVYRLVLTI
jgi:uncharacterized protein YbjQ (UPF0145 family)